MTPFWRVGEEIVAHLRERFPGTQVSLRSKEFSDFLTGLDLFQIVVSHVGDRLQPSATGRGLEVIQRWQVFLLGCSDLTKTAKEVICDFGEAG